MDRSRFLWMLVAAGIGGLNIFSVANAAIYLPGDTVPGVAGEVFGWTRGDTNSTYSGWDVFEAVLPPNDPSFGFVDSTPDVIGQFGEASSITVSPGGIQVGSGNAYSPFAALSFRSIVKSGTSGGDHTRIVAQFRTSGSELDYAGLLLSFNTAAPGTVAPSFSIETARTPLGGFGGDSVDHLAIWDIAASQAEFRLDFGAAVSSLALQEFHLDTFTQSAPFITPTAIPEPSCVALLGLAGPVLAMRRKSRVLTRSNG